MLQRRGPLRRFRAGALEKGDSVFQRFPRVAPVLLPAALSGIYRVPRPIFAGASLVAATWWTLATGLGAYFLGPPAADILSDIGVKGVIAVVIIAAFGLLYRALSRRYHSPEIEPERD
jgi:membrane protein DedA with SNARE-associated domain